MFVSFLVETNKMCYFAHTYNNYEHILIINNV